jgi:hypothetical protein
MMTPRQRVHVYGHPVVINSSGLRGPEIRMPKPPAWSLQNWWNYIQAHGMYDADLIVLVLPECDLGRSFVTMSAAGHNVRGSPFRLGNLMHKGYAVLASRFSVQATWPVDLTRARENAHANVAAVRGLSEYVGARPFVAVLIPSSGTFKELWPMFEAVLPDALDLRNALDDPMLWLDRIHFNARGHNVIGERIFERIARLLPG